MPARLGPSRIKPEVTSLMLYIATMAPATVGNICRSGCAAYSASLSSESEPAKSTVPSSIAFLPPPEPMAW